MPNELMKAAADDAARGSSTTVLTRQATSVRLRQTWQRFARNRLAVVGLVIIALFALTALFAPLIAPHDPITQNLPLQLQGPSREHLLGTDDFGRDLLSRIIVGSRISLLEGVIATAIGGVLGTLAGLFAGFYRRLDNLIMRLMDILLAFPSILLAISIIAILGPSLLNVMIAVGIRSVPSYARLVRATVLSTKRHEYVEAARAVGAQESALMFRHILPNCLSPVIVYSTLEVGGAILAASILAFLGLGVQPPTPEWGQMVNAGRNWLHQAPHIATYPGLAIFFVVMGFNLLGDGLRDILDPRMKNR